jgi:hypothetical protein
MTHEFDYTPLITKDQWEAACTSAAVALIQDRSSLFRGLISERTASSQRLDWKGWKEIDRSLYHEVCAAAWDLLLTAKG